MKDELIAFEDDIAQEFNNGNIPYPVHFENGNESQLIEIFKDVKEEDYIFTSWRGHYKALLKGVPKDLLKSMIMRGESMALNIPAYRVYGSAIVGGTIPIALGAALSIKRRGGSERVWCFLGDMTSECGIFHEANKYAESFGLPISWIIEDNGISVTTVTAESWGYPGHHFYGDTRRFKYESKFPHCGSGVRVNF